MHMRDDAERFAGVDLLKYNCMSCRKEDIAFPGTFREKSGASGLHCSNCGALYLGRNDLADLYSYLSNRLTMLIRSHTHKYYDGWAVCDNPYCKQRTRRQSLRGDACMADSCKGQGHLVPEYNGRQLHTQMKYLLSLFDADVAIDKKIRAEKAKTQEIREDQVVVTDNDRKKFKCEVSRNELHTMGLLKTHMENAIEWSGYNWVEPQLWTSIFAKSLAA
jgi:DNA polymerase alpha subunit A